MTSILPEYYRLVLLMTFFACQFCFPVTDYVMIPFDTKVWTFVVFIKKTVYEHENVQLWKKILSLLSSHDLQWENTY